MHITSNVNKKKQTNDEKKRRDQEKYNAILIHIKINIETKRDKKHLLNRNITLTYDNRFSR